MRCKRKDFIKPWLTALVVVMVVFSFQATLSGQEEETITTKRFCFSVGLKSGWSAWALGDFGISRESFENLTEIPGYSVTGEDFKGSLFGGLDLSLEYNLANSHKLGLSAGFQYFPGGTFESSWTYVEGLGESTTLNLTNWEIQLELFYKLPVGSDLFFRFGGGIDFFWETVDYDFSGNIWGEEYSWRGKLKDSGIGSHVSLGVEFFLDSNLALIFEGGYSFIKLNNFTGTLVDQGGTGTGMLLTMYQSELGETLSHYPIADPLPQNYRPAEIDFSGFKLSLGVLFKIGGPVSPPPPEPEDDEKELRDIAERVRRQAKDYEQEAEEAEDNGEFIPAGQLWGKAGEQWILERRLREKAGDITEAKRAWKNASRAFSNANRAFSKAVQAGENDADAWDKYATALEDYAEALDKLAETLDNLDKVKEAKEARKVATEARKLSEKAKAKTNNARDN